MTTLLKRLETGRVGNVPGKVLMSTTHTRAETLVAGFINEVQPGSGVKVAPTDFIEAVVDGNELIIYAPVFGAGGIITLVDIADSAAPANFEYQNTIFLAKNGNDANSGASPLEPKLTLTAALAARVTESTPTVINILDNGTYTISTTLAGNSNVVIFAPAATIASAAAGIPIFFIDTGSTLDITASALNRNTSGSVLGLEGGVLRTNVYSITGDISGDGFWSGNFGNMNGGITVDAGVINITFDYLAGAYTGSGTASLSATGGAVDANWAVSDTASIYANITSAPDAFLVVNTGTGDVSGTFIKNGVPSDYYGSGLNITNQFIQHEVSEIVDIVSPGSNNFTPTKDQSGAKFIVDAAVNVTCTLVSYTTDPELPVGFFFFVEQKQAGNVQFLSGDVIESVSNKDWTEGRGAIVRVDLMGTFVDVGPTTRYIWGLSGQIAGSAVTGAGINTYVSALIGNDTTGNGSLSQPYATISAGYAALAATVPTNRCNVVILDDEVYDEQVNMDTNLINLIGPQASLRYSGVGDALRVNCAGTVLVNLFDLSCVGGGLSLHVQTFSQVYLTVDQIENGNILQSSTGLLFIRGGKIFSDIECDAVGTVFWGSTLRTGTDTPGPGTINGISSQFTSNDFEIRGPLTASGLAYPTADGTNLQAIVTDGAGVLSFATVGGGLAKAGIAGTTQAAAVDTMYINQNAALTTITLPASFAIGDVVVIQGLGAGGWVLEAAAGDVIHYFGVDTSAGGSLASTGNDDSVQVMGVVANSEWSVSWAGGAGLTPA